MKNLQDTYNSLMNEKHGLKESGASWETLELLDDALLSIKKAIELNTKMVHTTKTDSMFS